MQNTLKLISRRFCPAVAALATLGLMLAGGQAVQAQASFSLLPLSKSGSTATFAVDLTGANLSGFDFNVTLDPAYLSFAGTAPFTSGTANPFDTQIYNALANPSDPSDLRVTYGQLLGPAVSNTGTVALGTFQVNILQPLPAAGTALSFGPIDIPDAPTNGSQIYDVNGNNVLTSTTGALLTPAAAVPEASSVVSLGLLLLLGSGGLLVSRRRRAANWFFKLVFQTA